MPRAPKRRRYMIEEDLEDQSETQGLESVHVPTAVEEDTSSSSTCSSSLPSSSSSPTSSSCYPLESSTTEKEFSDAEISSPPQSPHTEGSSPIAMASAPWSPFDEGSCSQTEEHPSTSQGFLGTESLSRSEIDGKVADLVQFLLLKYQIKEPATKAEMLGVLRNYQNHFPVIFGEACECMRLVFGIDMKEVDPVSHSHVLFNVLGLTYDGMLSEVQGLPKVGLLVFVLSIIFMEGNRVPEEVVWEAMSSMGVFAGGEHFIYGEPRKLITEDWVQEQYLEYRQVPNTDPAHYEFLWGPRAYAETSKMSILEFLAKINESDPRSFPVLYEEALRDEKERAQATVATRDDTTTLPITSSSTPSSSFSPE